MEDPAAGIVREQSIRNLDSGWNVKVFTDNRTYTGEVQRVVPRGNGDLLVLRSDDNGEIYHLPEASIHFVERPRKSATTSLLTALGLGIDSFLLYQVAVIVRDHSATFEPD